MSEDLKVLDVVALMEDLPDHSIYRGQVGTIVEDLSPRVYEVEFADDEGRAYAMIALRGHQLMRLHHAPMRAAG